MGVIYPQHERPVTGQSTRASSVLCVAILLADIKHCLTLREFSPLKTNFYFD